MGLFLHLLFSRPSAGKEQVHCGHKLERYYVPGRAREEAAGALLPGNHRSPHREVETESEEEEEEAAQCDR